MAEEKKKPEDEMAEDKPITAEQDEPLKAEEKPTDEPQSDENTEGERIPDEPEKPPESEAENETETAPPELSEEDKLKEENFRLKTQLEAMKLGFLPDTIEDAVVLAENIVKRDGGDIGKALQAVAKKYPDWKADAVKGGKPKGGFKVGSDGNNAGSDNDERLSRAFGIKKK